MKKIEVSQEDVDGIQRSLRVARLSLVDLEMKLSMAGLGSGKADAPEKKYFSVENFKSRLASQED